MILLLSAPGTVSVPSESLAAAAIRCVQARLAPEHGEYEVAVRTMPDAIELEGSRWRLLPSVNGLLAEGGSVTVRVEAESDRGRQRSAYVSLRIRRYSTVAVAVRSIERGGTNLGQAVRFERRETTGMREGAVGSDGELCGMRSRRLITEGTVLTPVMIEQVPMIRANAPVVLRVRTGSVVVSVQGVARGEGRRGERIAVSRPGARETVKGTVMDSTTVDVRIP
jgi:flagella basal body P-ring formation protein FlgA